MFYFSRFLEDKIIGLLHGEQMRQFKGILGWKSLVDDVEVFGPTNQLTALIPKLEGVDPDDSFSSVPYEKGSSFLYYIESLLGNKMLRLFSTKVPLMLTVNWSVLTDWLALVGIDRILVGIGRYWPNIGWHWSVLTEYWLALVGID